MLNAISYKLFRWLHNTQTHFHQILTRWDHWLDGFPSVAQGCYHLYITRCPAAETGDT